MFLHIGLFISSWLGIFLLICSLRERPETTQEALGEVMRIAVIATCLATAMSLFVKIA